MPTIEGKEGRVWIDEYVAKAGKQKDVVKGLRSLVRRTLAGCEEYVNPWKIPSFDSNGTVCGFMTGKEHVTFIFLRGAALPDPEGLLEGTGKSVRHVKVRTAADVKKPALKKLLVEAAKLNKREPMKGMKVDMNKRRDKVAKQ
ncbi:MAG TPA: DUF1801 domain-containing protein [Candidatus Sulfotelmatobacter sp.]|jgi:hypothetical protein|nr:DUF1801 domain-containing protein [Candidatus Sulfotelmatobacter sp.]